MLGPFYDRDDGVNVMRALVIGGNRFIGKYLVNSLVANKFEVTVLNRGNLKAEYVGEVEHLKADRTKAAEFTKALQGREFDIVYDLICSDVASAELTVSALKDKTQKIILLSSTFVYPFGQNLTEEQFDPLIHPLPLKDQKMSSTEVRKAIEAVFARVEYAKVTIARIPFVFGEDDSTGKLKKLVRMIMNKEEVYFPKKDLRISGISVDDAANILMKLSLVPFSGSINLASENSLHMGSVIRMIEESTYRNTKYAQEATSSNMSLFSLKSDWSLDNSRLKALDIPAKDPQSWIGKFVKKAISEVEKEIAR